MKYILLTPLLLPLIAATFSLLPRQWRLDRELLALVGTGGHFFASLYLFDYVYQNGEQVIFAGGWIAPFGIVLVFDLLSTIMLCMSGFIGLSIALYSLGSLDKARQAFGFFPLLHLLLMGCSGAFLAGDVFNLYVWFEVILIASFVLLTLGGEKAQITGGLKYVVINIIASCFFLIAVGLLYTHTESLNMAHLAQIFKNQEMSLALPLISILFFIVFAIKAALFPFFFWLPDSYHTPPIAVSAIFAGLLTKVGVYAFLRFYTLIFVPHDDILKSIFSFVAIATMVTGVLGAWAQKDIRKILSFHIISQIGYMMIGLAIMTPWAIAGSIYFMLHNIFAKTNLFLISGVIAHLGGSYHVKKLGGLYHSFFLLSLLFLIPALSLAGIPPLSGFFGKFTLIKAALESEAYVMVFFALLVSIVTTLSMLKIWHHAFWQDPPGDFCPLDARGLGEKRHYIILPILMLSAGTLFLSIYANSFLNLCLQIADSLLNPDAYIQAVIGGAA